METQMNNTEISEALNDLMLHEKGGTYWKIEKDCVKFCGSHKFALFLSDLISRYRYFSDNKMLDEDGMFFIKKDTIKEDTLLSHYDQSQAFSFWSNCGVLTKKKKGLPAKNYYKINLLRYYEVVYPSIFNKKLKNLTSGSEKISPHNKNKDNNNKKDSLNTSYYKESGFSKEKPTAKDFNFVNKQPKTYVEPIKTYDENVIEIFDYCNSFENLTKHRKDTKSYKSALNVIEKLLNSGETKEILMNSRKRYADFMKDEKHKDTFIDPAYPIWNPSIKNFFYPDERIKKSYKKCGFVIKSLYEEFKLECYPENKFAKLIKDQHSVITEKLKKKFFRPNGFNAYHENLIRKASVKLSDLHQGLTENNLWSYGMDLNLNALSNELCHFIDNDEWWKSKITPKLLNSDSLIDGAFYNYLLAQGFVKEKKSGTETPGKALFDIYDDNYGE